MPMRKIGDGCPATVHARLQAAEAEAVRKLAESAGMTVSAYLRRLALAAIATTTGTESA